MKLEAGWDQAKAAAFSYSSTAIPRLTGALITVAAFMPIGFSKSTSGEYAGGIFWIVGIAVLFSWVVSGLFTPYLAVKMLPKDFGKHHKGGDPYQTSFYKKLRRLIDLALERRWWVIGATGVALVLAVAGMKFVPQQFFPNSSRPELLVELRMKRRRILRGDDRAGEEDGGRSLQGRGRPLLHGLHGRRRTAVLSLPEPRTAQPRLCAVRGDDA